MSRRSLEDKLEHAVPGAPLGGAVCNIKGLLTAERRGAATGDERFKAEDEGLISGEPRWRKKKHKRIEAPPRFPAQSSPPSQTVMGIWEISGYLFLASPSSCTTLQTLQISPVSCNYNHVLDYWGNQPITAQGQF